MAQSNRNEIFNQVDNAEARFNGVITKTEKQIFDSAVDAIKRLDVDASGYIKTTTANLKLLQEIKSRLERIANNKEYLQGVKELAKAFADIYKAQVAYYSNEFAQKSMNEHTRDRYDAMKRIAVSNTIDGLTGAGLQSGVLDSLNKMLLKAVTGGEKYSDLVSSFRNQLISSKDGQSAFAKYAGTYATTALTQYAGQNNRLFTDDLGCEWFEYVGSQIETTREFCNVILEHHPYIHKTEIPQILKGEIVSQKTGELIHVSLNPKTGLPKGMIEGTTPENFQINVGGWNCRHQLCPVAKESVPADIRAKFEKNAEPIEQQHEPTDWERWYDDNEGWLNYYKPESEKTGVSLVALYDKNATYEQLDAKMYDLQNQMDAKKDEWKDAVYLLSEFVLKATNAKAYDIANKSRNELLQYEWKHVIDDGMRRQQIQIIKTHVQTYEQELNNFAIAQSQSKIPQELRFNAKYWQGRAIKLQQEIFEYLKYPVKCIVVMGEGQSFQRGRGQNCEVHLYSGNRNAQSAWEMESVCYHEYGHAIAEQRGLLDDPKLLAMRELQRKKLLTKGEYTIEEQNYNYDKHEWYTKSCTKRMPFVKYVDTLLINMEREVWRMTNAECVAKYGLKKHDALEQIGSTRDTIKSLIPKYGDGHSTNYFSGYHMKEHEYLAHAFENKFIGNKIFKQVLPEIYEEMIKYIEDVKKTF